MQIAPHMPDERARVIAEARRWIGTPYHQGADILGVGVDCGMFIVRAYVDSGLVAPFDPRPYAHNWFVHRADQRYIDAFDRLGRRVHRPALGGAMAFRFGLNFSHAEIVTRLEPLTIIHAFPDARCVMEERLEENARLAKCLNVCFSLWPGA